MEKVWSGDTSQRGGQPPAGGRNTLCKPSMQRLASRGRGVQKWGRHNAAAARSNSWSLLLHMLPQHAVALGERLLHLGGAEGRPGGGWDDGWAAEQLGAGWRRDSAPPHARATPRGAPAAIASLALQAQPREPRRGSFTAPASRPQRQHKRCPMQAVRRLPARHLLLPPVQLLNAPCWPPQQQHAGPKLTTFPSYSSLMSLPASTCRVWLSILLRGRKRGR